MKCVSCGTVLSPNFKHALAQNVCPACGGSILDEESLAIIEDIEKLISSEVTVREGTAKKLAMALITKYNISLNDASVTKQVEQPKEVEDEQKQFKIAPPSAMQKIVKEMQDPSVVSASDIKITEEMTQEEMDKALETAVRKRYNLVDGVVLSKKEDQTDEVDLASEHIPPFLDNEEHPGLEKERLLRLAKQKQALMSGGGSFRRG